MLIAFALLPNAWVLAEQVQATVPAHDPNTQTQVSSTNRRTQPPDIPVPNASASTGEDLLTDAKTYLAANDLPHADSALRRYLAAKPDSAEAMYLLGRTLQRENQPKDSLQWFTRAASLFAPGSEDLRIVGMDYVLLNDYPDAIHWLERSVERNARNSEAWYDLGRAWMMQGDYTAAEKALLRATSLHPRFVKAEDNLGVVYEAQNRPTLAAEAYKQAVAWQQGEPQPSEQPLLNYGTFLVTQQRTAEALPLLAKAVAIAPGNAKVHEQFAHALEQQGQIPEAQEQMRQAVAIEPGNAAFHYQLGQLYRRSGDAAKGKEEMQLSSKLYGTSSSTQDH